MTRRAIIAGLSFTAVLVIAGSAEANWGWLEKISGPGPFKADIPSLSVQVVCVDGADYKANLLFCKPSSHKPRGFVGFEFQTWKSIENVLFVPDARASFAEVRIVDFRANLMIRIHDAIDIGMGAGFHRFSGPSFDEFWRMSVEPARASIAPLMLFGTDRRLRIFKVEVGATRFRGEFTNEDFCAPPACDPLIQTVPFSAEGEYLWRSAFVIDFSPFLWR